MCAFVCVRACVCLCSTALAIETWMCVEFCACAHSFPATSLLPHQGSRSPCQALLEVHVLAAREEVALQVVVDLFLVDLEAVNEEHLPEVLDDEEREDHQQSHKVKCDLYT